MITKEKLFLVIIFILALVLRFYLLGEHPTFISDEASIGYNAYSLTQTGKDEWGKLLPLTFKSFGEYKLPFYIYLSVPSVAFLGLNELAVRLPSALLGALTVFLIYWLVQLLLTDQKDNRWERIAIGLLAATLLAINPWHIQVSRIALEANAGLFLSLLGLVYLLKARQKPRNYYFAFILFALTFYTYNSCRVFVPLFLLFYFLVIRQELNLKKLILPVAAFFLLITPLLYNGFAGSGERLYKVGFFNDPGLLAKINESRGQCLTNHPVRFCVVRYNRPVVYSLVFASNYLSHFSPKFLFTEGSGLAQYQVPGQGVLYLWELPFLVLGLIYFWSKKKVLLVIVLWLLIAIIPNSLTGSAHPVRSILFLPFLPILTAAGLFLAVNFLKQRRYFKYLFGSLITLVVLTYFSLFLFKYFFLYPLTANWNWQKGYGDLYATLAKYENQFDKIYISKYYGEPHIFYLFYEKYNPAKYQANTDVTRYDRDDHWVNVDRIGKYVFVQNPADISLKENELLVVPIKEFSYQAKIAGVIKYPNQQIAFLLLKK